LISRNNKSFNDKCYPIFAAVKKMCLHGFDGDQYPSAVSYMDWCNSFALTKNDATFISVSL
ncbi:MAG: hypothetical protein J7527_07785, partial [Chitinophagaceae bacterium]|nr:hypothetical protein [Chitinophagaceae bacterium]